MAEIFDSDDDSVQDLTQPEVIDLCADDDDLAAALNAQLDGLDEYIDLADSDSDDDVQFVSQSPPKRRKVEEEEVTFVKSTPPSRPVVDVSDLTPPSRPVVDVDADEAMARKLHEQINNDDFQVVERPKSASKPSAKKTPPSKRKKSDGPFGGRDVLKKQRQGLFDFLGKKAKSLRITDIVPNAHSEPSSKLYERFLSAYTFATTKKIKLLFHGSPPQNYPNILANGLDPGRRGASSGQRLGSDEYFGTHAEVSTEYCGGGRQMIVFAVLTDPRSTREGGKIVVSSDVSHQLPIATVSFANPTPPRPTDKAMKVSNAAEKALIRKDRKRGWPG